MFVQFVPKGSNMPKMPKGVLQPGYSPPDEGFVTSQKADGLLFLQRRSQFAYLPTTLIQPKQFSFRTKKVELPQGKVRVSNVFKNMYDYSFVRACPKTPRHGVLESFPLEIHKLWDKRRIAPFLTEADAERFRAALKSLRAEGGMLAIQKMIQADASAVLSPEGLVIGPGRDGVTAGRGESICWPEASIYAQTDLPEGGPYQLEFIRKEYNIFCVQIRAAESAQLQTHGKGDSGWLPNNPVSLRGLRPVVIESLDQLGALEKEPEGAKIVVWHPKGNALSHAAAWCVQRKFPYVCAEPKKSGWLWEDAPGSVCWSARKPKVQPFHRPVPAAFAENFWAGVDRAWEVSSLFQKNSNGELTRLLRCSHLFFSGLSLSRDLARGAGYAVVAILRGAVASTMGELRYVNPSVDPWPWSIYSSFIKPFDFSDFSKEFCSFFDRENYKGMNRNTIYSKLLYVNALRTGPLLRAARRLFCIPITYENPGIGGPKWAWFALATEELRQALEDHDFERCNLAFQKVLHAAHNGGWALNKLFAEDIMNQCSQELRPPGAIDTAFRAVELIRWIDSAPAGHMVTIPDGLIAAAKDVCARPFGPEHVWQPGRLVGRISRSSVRGYIPPLAEALAVDGIPLEGDSFPEVLSRTDVAYLDGRVYSLSSEGHTQKLMYDLLAYGIRPPEELEPQEKELESQESDGA